MAFIYELSLLCVIGIVIHGYAAYNISKNICIEGAVRLIRDRYKCKFNLSYAEDILKEAGTCPRKCSVHLNILNSWQTLSLHQVNVTIGTEQVFTKTICELQHNSASMQIECSSWIQDKYTVFYKDNNAACKDRLDDAQCYSIDHNCICHCYHGYFMYNRSCFKDRVPIGGFCGIHEQCTGSNNSETCVNGRCRCLDGYLLIDLECIQVQLNEFGRSIRNQKDINIGPILGTLFGGMIIGVILTSVIAILIFKKIRTDIKKREEPIVMFANDVIYSSANVVECENIKAFQANDKKRKVLNVLPNSCSEKGAVYSFVARKPRIVQPSEGVYNHLHEQERHDIVDDNYDHACVASNIEREPCIYSNMA